MDLRRLNTVWKFDFQYCLEISDADLLLQNYFSEGSIVLRWQFYWILSNCFFSWKLFHEIDREVYLILFRRTNSAYVQKGNSNCGLKISNNPDVWRIGWLGITHFNENHLIKIHKIDHKISGWSLCQDYLGVFSLWYQKLQGL